MRNISSKNIGRWQSIWKWLRSVFVTAQTTGASDPDVISGSVQNTNMTAPSESQEAILHPNRTSTAEDGSLFSEAIPDSLPDLRQVSSSKSSISSSSALLVDEQSSGDFSDGSDVFSVSECMPDIAFPKVTISAFSEIGQAETSIEVPLQRSYTGRKPVISSSLADTPCATLGVQVVLDRLNATLGTSHTLDTPSLPSLLNECIEKNYDFGTAYGRLRQVWNTDGPGTIQHELRKHEENDKERRQKALIGNRIVNPSLPPRRVWDLYSNRVVPWWIARKRPQPISHAWMDEKDRVDVWTSINGQEWPVPIPKGASLELIRIEMLNLGAEYVWLDVLCWRQRGGPREDLRVEEWKVDVPTIGEVYRHAELTVIYLGGLGMPFSLKAEDLYSDRSWFRRAWTLLDARSSGHKIFAGDTPDGTLHKASTYRKKLELLKAAIHDIENEEHSEMERRAGAERYFPYVTISALTEINRQEPLSIDIPLQREYTGRKPVIQSSLADTRYEKVDELFEQLNTTLGTSYKLTDSLFSLLQSYIVAECDFGTVYGFLRPKWHGNLETIQEDLMKLGFADQKMRENALRDNRISDPQMPPRRVWDLYSNRVVPYWVANKWPWGISHAWMDEKDRADVPTPINGYEWPVPIPKDTNLDLIRIEILNVGAEYAWLDVLCLRQVAIGGSRKLKHLQAKEWKVDVPTIGSVYRFADMVVYYFNGLGRPLRFKTGYLESHRCWFNRAWTLQEINKHIIIAGDTDVSPPYAEPLDEECEVSGFQAQLMSLKELAHKNVNLFKWLADMRNRTSVHPVDRVVGLAFPLRSQVIPAYNGKWREEEAWKALLNMIQGNYRGHLLFLYPEPATGDRTWWTWWRLWWRPSWRPSWRQVMHEQKPEELLFLAEANLFEIVVWNKKTGDDEHNGYCIENGRVQGLDTEGRKGVERPGQLIINDPIHPKTEHQFKIVAMHQFLIRDGSYTLIGSREPRNWEFWVLGKRLRDRRIRKVSVFRLPDVDERRRLEHLGAGILSTNRFV